jgi:ABC-2 type transport system ATP-binding protein
MKSQIEFIDVVKRYKDTKALNGLSFTIGTNEFVALVGNNGCGKTTTINILCNLISYDSGDVFVFDKKVTPYYVSFKSKLGVLLSRPIFINEFSPYEYLSFVCKFQNVDNNLIQQRIEEVISIFGIANSKSKKIDNYSSGDKMKISFAAAIIHNPLILILDEPFIHLDIQTIDFLVTLLSSFKNKKTLFITSHNLDLVTILCERFLIMEDGRIIADFPKSTYTSLEAIKILIKERIVKHKTNIDTLDWLK